MLLPLVAVKELRLLVDRNTGIGFSAEAMFLSCDGRIKDLKEFAAAVCQEIAVVFIRFS